MVVGNHHVDRGRGVVRQPSAIIAIAIDSALATGEDKNRTLARDQSRQGRNMCMREQARTCWRRTAAWARTLRRSRPCPSPRTSTSEAAASVEAAREKAEAVAEVGAAEVLGLAALAASAVAGGAGGGGDRRSAPPQSASRRRWSHVHGCGRELARARANARQMGLMRWTEFADARLPHASAGTPNTVRRLKCIISLSTCAASSGCSRRYDHNRVRRGDLCVRPHAHPPPANRRLLLLSQATRTGRRALLERLGRKSTLPAAVAAEVAAAALGSPTRHRRRRRCRKRRGRDGAAAWHWTSCRLEQPLNA